MVVAANTSALLDETGTSRVPSIVVVDPRFDAYASLAASARMGRIDLHLRSAGAAALKLADRIEVDAWLISSELDDMSGEDFVGLLQARRGDAKVALVTEWPVGSRQQVLAEQAAREAGVDVVLSTPITVSDLEQLLGLPVEERRRRFAANGRSWAAVPVSVGAAMVAIAVLMIG
jgi:DNA-binding response OmpR family regulator